MLLYELIKDLLLILIVAVLVALAVVVLFMWALLISISALGNLLGSVRRRRYRTDL